jgi:hypothetical protein
MLIEEEMVKRKSSGFPYVCVVQESDTRWTEVNVSALSEIWNVTARCFAWSKAGWIQSTILQPVTVWSVLILYSHLRLDVETGMFPSYFPTNILNVDDNFSYV